MYGQRSMLLRHQLTSGDVAVHASDSFVMLPVFRKERPLWECNALWSRREQGKKECKIVEKRVCDLYVLICRHTLWQTEGQKENQPRHRKLGGLLRNKLGWRVLVYLEMRSVIVVKYHSQIYHWIQFIKTSLLQAIFYRMVSELENNNVRMNMFQSRKPKLTAVVIRCADHATPTIR
jgi:hypothetical protein